MTYDVVAIVNLGASAKPQVIASYDTREERDNELRKWQRRLADGQLSRDVERILPADGQPEKKGKRK